MSSGAMWAGLDLAGAPQAEPAAFGGCLDPETLLAACRRGLFPLPADGEPGALVNRTLYEPDVRAGRIAVIPGGGDPYRLAWHCPDPQPVLAVGSVHLTRTARRMLRNRCRHWHTTADTCFADVVEACRRDRRPRWLTDELAAALRALHGAGWAHSVEVWDGDRLVGGVFGVGVGVVFSADSMFHAAPYASKVAVADLADRLSETSVRLVNVQVSSSHTTELGARPLARADYLQLLAGGDDPVRLAGDPRPARRLAAPPTEGRPDVSPIEGRPDP